MENPTFLNWSSGKDAALALDFLLQEATKDIKYLLTTVNTEVNRVSIHGLRKELLIQQLKAINIPHIIVDLPAEVDMDTYNSIMDTAFQQMKVKGIETAVYGDIFLEDVREYRESHLRKLGMKCAFPLWKKDTTKLAHKFIDRDLKAVVVTVSDEKLDRSYVGRKYDLDFLSDLPNDVDPCGENGEFHTFCYDAPYFSAPVLFQKGKIIRKELPAPHRDDKQTMGFWYCDLLPEQG